MCKEDKCPSFSFITGKMLLLPFPFALWLCLKPKSQLWLFLPGKWELCPPALSDPRQSCQARMGPSTPNLRASISEVLGAGEK